MKPTRPLSPIPKSQFHLSENLNCRDMRGKLIGIMKRMPLEYGNIVRLNNLIYIVKGICIINGRFNVNLEEVRGNDRQ